MPNIHNNKINFLFYMSSVSAKGIAMLFTSTLVGRETIMSRERNQMRKKVNESNKQTKFGIIKVLM